MERRSDVEATGRSSGTRIEAAVCRAPGASRKLRRLLLDAVSALSADEAALWLFVPGEQRLVAALNQSRQSREDRSRGDRKTEGRTIEGIDVEIKGSLVGLVAMTGEGICVGPDAAYNQEVAKRLAQRTFAMVAAPIVVRDEICGVLSAVNLHGVTETIFTHEHLRTVQWKAYLLGLVLADCLEADPS
jgi:hypothetical protein